MSRRQGAARGGPTGAPRERAAGSQRLRAMPALIAAVVLLLGTAGCDDIAKRVPWFAFMLDGPAVETYEEEPVPPPEGAVPVEGTSPSFPLPVADTTSALQNPLSGTGEEIARGEEVYTTFCLPCHGDEGQGRGPAVNHDGEHPGRFPFVPALDLTAGTGPERSDGYLWGMMENGRGLMPEYRRIPDRDRWHVVEYVRELQRRAGAEPVRGVAGPDGAGGDR